VAHGFCNNRTSFLQRCKHVVVNLLSVYNLLPLYILVHYLTVVVNCVVFLCGHIFHQQIFKLIHNFQKRSILIDRRRNILRRS